MHFKHLIMATHTHTHGGQHMAITVDRKIATGLIGRAKTGNELLSVLDMIVDSFTKSTKVEPTVEEIEF
jgi:hypothetical protein